MKVACIVSIVVMHTLHNAPLFFVISYDGKVFILRLHYNLSQNCWAFCNKTYSPLPKINVVKDSALRMNTGHVYTNIAWWRGKEGEDAWLKHGY